MFGPSSSSAPAGSEETREADGGNSSTNLFGSSGKSGWMMDTEPKGKGESTPYLTSEVSFPSSGSSPRKPTVPSSSPLFPSVLCFKGS